jgi:[ribosomal protein S5]-alanine N-acetyltransferase
MNLPDSIPVFTTERLILRDLTEQDEAAIFAMFVNPEVMRYWSSPPMQTSSEALDFINHNNGWFAAREGLTWGIARQSDGTVIGMCTVFNLSDQNRRGEIGYALAREAWGQGYMHEALTTMVAYAFGSLNLIRLEADIDPRNDGSRKTLERLGFIQDGLLRERWIVAEEISDSAMFGLLKREWEGKQL